MFAALALTLAVAPPAGGPNAVDLRWKFIAGDTFYQTAVQTMKQSMTVAGNDIEIEQKQRIVTKLVVKSATDKETVLEQTFVQWKMTTKPEMPGAAGGLTDKLLGTTFTLTLDDRHQVTKFEGFDAFLDKAAAGNPAMKAMFKQSLTEDAMKEMAAQSFRGPGKPVAPGDMWVQKQKVSLGPLGDMAMTMNFKYVGPAGGKDKTTYTGEVKWEPAVAGAAGPATVTKADVKAEKLEGTQLFDRSVGRLAEHAMAMKMGGTLTMSVNGQEVEMALKQDTTLKQTLTATEPAKE